jgi:hypothetical protein
MYSVLLKDYPTWAMKTMYLQQFQQIRAAFHHEVETSNVGDKCYQLLHALNTLNQVSYHELWQRRCSFLLLIQPCSTIQQGYASEVSSGFLCPLQQLKG